MYFLLDLRETACNYQEHQITKFGDFFESYITQTVTYWNGEKYVPKTQLTPIYWQNYGDTTDFIKACQYTVIVVDNGRVRTYEKLEF